MGVKDLFGEELHQEPEIDGEPYAGTVQRETAAAILFDDGERRVWLPKSRIAIEELSGLAGARALARAVIVTIPDWLAREKGLIELPAHRSQS